MRKIVLRIFSALSIIISLFFIVFLLLTAFGKINVEEFDNRIVKTLCLSLSGTFVILSIVSQVLLYSNGDAIKEILLHHQKGGTTKASVAVVKKIAKTTVKNTEGVKYCRSKIVAGDFGVRLKVRIAVKNRDLLETEQLIRAMLEKAFSDTLGFKFYAIDIHVKKFTSDYQVNAEKVKVQNEAVGPDQTDVSQPEEKAADTESAPSTETNVEENVVEKNNEPLPEQTVAETPEPKRES